jgi:hypothetical protein
MSMLFGTTILCDACALEAAAFCVASESILRGLDSLFLLMPKMLTHPC